MTQTSYHHTYRAAFAIAAAATVFLTSHADAQMLGQNIFGGTNTSPISVSTPTGTLSASTAPTTAQVGPGFTGTVILNAGALDKLTETIDGAAGTLVATETGPGVLGLPVAAGVGGTFVATKTIGATFVPNQSYSFTLNATTTAELSLLSGLNVMFSTVENGTPTTIYSASGGTGLLGIANTLNLFNGTTTSTFNFMTPAAVTAGSPITVTISGGLTAAALANDTFTFSGATLNAVPEPGTVGAMGVGIAALVALRFRRRLARN